MYATFDDFIARYGAQRAKNLTLFTGVDATAAEDAPARRDAVERALQEATDTIEGYADIPTPVPPIVRRWCLVLAQTYLAQGSGSSSVYSELDRQAYTEVMGALIRAENGDIPWETTSP